MAAVRFARAPSCLSFALKSLRLTAFDQWFAGFGLRSTQSDSGGQGYEKIGCFRQEDNKFSGNITTLQFSVQARMVPNDRKIAAEEADFIVVQTKANGYMPEIGAAWKRTTRDGGIHYLAVEIDDPSCHHPILATLWQAEDGLWYLFWHRYATGNHDAEKLFVQEELKPPLAWHRVPQKMTRYLQELFPQLVI